MTVLPLEHCPAIPWGAHWALYEPTHHHFEQTITLAFKVDTLEREGYIDALLYFFAPTHHVLNMKTDGHSMRLSILYKDVGSELHVSFLLTQAVELLRSLGMEPDEDDDKAISLILREDDEVKRRALFVFPEPKSQRTTSEWVKHAYE
jgi:hypothetical protein